VGKALEIFKHAHAYLKKKREEGKVSFRIYFNGQDAELTGFMLIHGKPEHLMEGGEELERLYMQAAAVVDNLSSKMLIGGTEEGGMEHLNLWRDVQIKLGYL
jgi:hypothetical protein